MCLLDIVVVNSVLFIVRSLIFFSYVMVYDTCKLEIVKGFCGSFITSLLISLIKSDAWQGVN